MCLYRVHRVLQAVCLSRADLFCGVRATDATLGDVAEAGTV